MFKYARNFFLKLFNSLREGNIKLSFSNMRTTTLTVVIFRGNAIKNEDGWTKS